MKRIIILTLALIFVMSFFSVANAACKCAADKTITNHVAYGTTKDYGTHKYKSGVVELNCARTTRQGRTKNVCKMCQDVTYTNTHDNCKISHSKCGAGTVTLK